MRAKLAGFDKRKEINEQVAKLFDTDAETVSKIMNHQWQLALNATKTNATQIYLLGFGRFQVKQNKALKKKLQLTKFKESLFNDLENPKKYKNTVSAKITKIEDVISVLDKKIEHNGNKL